MKKSKNGNSKSSPKPRPRRRASQTYFFKYQLARDPLKAEEEDLKLALLASLQQCDDDISKQQLQEQLKRQQLIYDHHQSNHNQQPKKQQKQKHPLIQETVIQTIDPAPPTCDKYRPETEDFLTFICFRIPAQNFTLSQQQNELPTLPTASNNSTSNRRRPTRHSPRLASSSRKISELKKKLNHYTAYDSQINYEEDMKKASMALEDMAQEINGSDDNKLDDNNRHLVKGLMTREFAGAFADEEIIFESMKNHKL